MAVDRALALDPRQRPASADELRQPLADGARGVGPDRTDGRPASAGPPTSATSVVGQQRGARHRRARAPRSSSASRARRARPRPAPTCGRRAPPAARPRAAAAARSASSASLLVLLLLAAGGAAAVVATSNSDQAVQLRRVVYDDVNQGVDAVKQLVNDNTIAAARRLDAARSRPRGRAASEVVRRRSALDGAWRALEAPHRALRRRARAQRRGLRGQRARPDRLAQAAHDALDEGEVVQREQAHAGELARVGEVAQVAAREARARRPGTGSPPSAARRSPSSAPG